MTPEQFTQALAQLGLKQADYARLIDVSQKTIWMWVSGRTAVPKLASEHLGLLLALDDLHRRYLGRRSTVVLDVAQPPNADLSSELPDQAADSAHS
jgi:transcriptional regulator with XRE-family HTH domain